MDLDPNTRRERMIALEAFLREILEGLLEGRLRAIQNKVEGAHRVVSSALRNKKAE